MWAGYSRPTAKAASEDCVENRDFDEVFDAVLQAVLDAVFRRNFDVVFSFPDKSLGLRLRVCPRPKMPVCLTSRGSG